MSLSVAPHGCYPCKGEDRWCAIAAETEAQWSALAIFSVVTSPAMLISTNASGCASRSARQDHLA